MRRMASHVVRGHALVMACLRTRVRLRSPDAWRASQRGPAPSRPGRPVEDGRHDRPREGADRTMRCSGLIAVLPATLTTAASGNAPHHENSIQVSSAMIFAQRRTLLAALVSMPLTAAVLSTLAVLPPSAASAVVIVDISGLPGTGVTTWEFSGSETVTLRSLIIDDDDGAVSDGWIVPSDFYSGSDTFIPFTSGTAQFTVMPASPAPQPFLIVAVGAEASEPNTGFGLALDNGTANAAFSFLLGTTLTFSGFGVAPVDVTEFAFGVTTAEFYAPLASSPAVTGFDVQFTVTSIPIPAALPMLLSGLLGLAVLRRRTD